MSETARCSRCRSECENLRPLPRVLRVISLPASLMFPPLSDSCEYCHKCRRAMMTPVLFLVGLAYVILYLAIRHLLS